MPRANGHSIALDGCFFKDPHAFATGVGVCYVCSADAVPENAQALLDSLSTLSKRPRMVGVGKAAFVDAVDLFDAFPSSVLSEHGFFTRRSFLEVCGGRPAVASIAFDLCRGEHPSVVLESLTARDWADIEAIEGLARSKRRDPAELARAAKRVVERAETRTAGKKGALSHGGKA